MLKFSEEYPETFTFLIFLALGFVAGVIMGIWKFI